MDGIRAEMGHRIDHDPNQWPLVRLRVSRSEEHVLAHLSVDLLVVDYAGLQQLLGELRTVVRDADETDLPVLHTSFRTHVLAGRRARTSPAYQKARAYWLRRMDELPTAPELPTIEHDPAEHHARFTRLEHLIDEQAWEALLSRCRARELTPSAVLLACYADTIARWSRRPRFLLNVPTFDRGDGALPTENVIGDFTTVELLEVDLSRPVSVTEHARALHGQLLEDLAHKQFSGSEVLAELTRRRADGAAQGHRAEVVPIVFTSALTEQARGPESQGGQIAYARTQTPQVWIDCQIMERSGGLGLSWDARLGIFPNRLLEDAFAYFAAQVRHLADSDVAWDEPFSRELPAEQDAARTRYNATDAPIPSVLLHQAVVDHAQQTPDANAVITAERTLTYRDLVARADGLAARLLDGMIDRSIPIAVIAHPGWEQIVAVLGILRAGHAYVPVDINQPVHRRDTILRDGGITTVVTASAVDGLPPELEVLAVDEISPATTPLRRELATAPDDLAYVIYTSGSTGTPKGVMVSHRAAVNTVIDINTRFDVGSGDVMLALAGLGFDLSVYDIFGVLGAGGSIVLPHPARRGDPSHWAALLAEHHVTLWNSVPAQAQMLCDYLQSAAADIDAVDLPGRSLRLCLMSGDWIPITLPDGLRELLPALNVVSAGGATEAAIWSIHHVVDAVDRTRPSIPYGIPLANQRMYVLDSALRDCPDWVVGDIHIGGVGLALGYLGDEERTAASFITHPTTGMRLYRTGDLGRFTDDGEIEFLGREDQQFKIRGYRIELAEVESAVLTHPAVAATAALVHAGPTGNQLQAFVVPERIDVGAHLAGESADLVRVGADILEQGANDVDTIALHGFLDQLDAVSIRLMAGVLTEAGLFVDEQPLTARQVADALGAPVRHAVLVRRWLRALHGRGHLQVDESGAYLGTLTGLILDGNAAVDREWEQLARAERAVRWSAELLDHVHTTSDRVRELLRGDLDIAELLYPGAPSDATFAMYRDNLGVRILNPVIGQAVRDIADRRAPGQPLRVLEVGAGLGGTSVHVVSALIAAGNLDSIEYTVTDPSRYFVAAAREQFGAHPWMRFAAFDPAREPLTQGLDPHSFDVLICANGLHGQPDIPQALANLNTLAAPQSWLVLLESTDDNAAPMMLSNDFMEVRAGGPTDARRDTDTLLASVDTWQSMLAAASVEALVQLPAREHPLAKLGQHVFVGRLGADRAQIDATELTRHTATRVPDYMVPTRWHLLDQLPTTGNSKVDRKALSSLMSAPEQSADTDAGEAPVDDLERQLSTIWSELLSRPQVGRHDDFFALGGDSLLIARLVGRIRDERTELEELEWDVVLRHMLRTPTVAGLAHYIRSVSDSAANTGTGTEPALPALSLLAGSGSGPATVLVHAGVGTLMPYRSLITEIRRRARGRGSLYGLEIPSMAQFLDAPPEGLLEKIAAEYATELLATGCQRFHIVGYCLGGLIATEVARALTESGADVATFTAISSHSPDFRLDDELISEYSFAMMIGINPADLGFPADQWRVAAAGRQVLAQSPGVMRADGYADLAGEFADIGQAFRNLANVPRPQRIARMCEAVPPAIGSYTPTQMTRFFSTFRQSVFAITRYHADYYAGDITFLRHSGSYPFPGSKDAVTEYWNELCLGELDIIDIDGDHYDCLSAEHSPAVLALLGRITSGEVIA